jgi:hypothetical protein
MSLKSFHVFFILVSISFSMFFGVWGVRNHSVTANTVHLCLGISSFVGAAALIAYLLVFFQKAKDLTP